MRLLESLDAEGIITGCESERLQDAYLVMRKAIHRLNLQEKSLDIPQAQFLEIRGHIIDIYNQYLV